MGHIQDDDIDRLFQGLADKIGGADEGTHRMFRLLVQTVLTFRDDLIRAEQGTLTIGETQEALDAFLEVLKTHAIPKTLSGHPKELVVRWLAEIKKSIHH